MLLVDESKEIYIYRKRLDWLKKVGITGTGLEYAIEWNSDILLYQREEFYFLQLSNYRTEKIIVRKYKRP